MDTDLPSITVGARFCGPPGSANGGYVSGLVARAIGSLVTVRLVRPPPLQVPLRLQGEPEGRWGVYHGDTRVIEVRPGALSLVPPPAPGYVEALRASLHDPDLADHPCPGCFVCGCARAAGDGLRIFAGPLNDSPQVAAAWLPDASLGLADGKVAPEFIAAALDCPGFQSLRTGAQLWLLGEYTVHIDRRVHVGEPCVILGWPIEVKGRRATVGTALYDEDGECCAMAQGVWIAPRSAP